VIIDKANDRGCLSERIRMEKGRGVENGGGTCSNSGVLMRLEVLTMVNPSAGLRDVLTQKNTIKIWCQGNE
jgi:hypothetical protein